MGPAREHRARMYDEKPYGICPDRSNRQRLNPSKCFIIMAVDSYNDNTPMHLYLIFIPRLTSRGG